ncbi:hypothetical protein CRE_23715 [Caenorhabditis remanei]|uniref:Uncharacterized protein n=1 Tax=Caenorhabditis remanei TaxID=31234 RepID=E3N9C1_CAERE|nr:hypothetical protein CRE_23715 [Caenorhabditis remanei]
MNVSTEIYHYNSWRNDEEKETERLVTVIFILAIFSIFILTIAGAILIGFLKPQWFRLNIYQDQLPQMTDCSCLNICLPCQSCSFRRLLNGCFPRLVSRLYLSVTSNSFQFQNLKQRFNCITTCCTRQGPDKLNLVCCVV